MDRSAVVSWVGLLALPGCGKTTLSGASNVVDGAPPDESQIQSAEDAARAATSDASSGAFGGADIGGETSVDSDAGDASMAGDTSMEGDAGSTICTTRGAPPTGGWCPVTLCGNGKRDDCPSPFGGHGQVTENCDGTDLGGSTCETLNYGSGTLRCSVACSFDTAQCERCAALSSQLVACKTSPIEAVSPTDVDIATSSTETAVAWISQGEDDDHWSAHIARVGLDGAQLGSQEVLGRCLSTTGTDAGYEPNEFPRTAVTSDGAGGWLVAVTSRTGIDVEHFDGALSSQGRMHVSSGDSLSAYGIDNRTELVFAPRAKGGPLLSWVEHDSPVHQFARASVLSADGRSATVPVTVIDHVSDGRFLSAVFVEDGFLVAVRAGDGPFPNGSDGIVVARVELDGSVVTAPQRPVGESAEYPFLAAHGTSPRLAYRSYFNATDVRGWVVLDSSGRAASTPLALVSTRRAEPEPIVSLGDDVVVGTLDFMIASDGYRAAVHRLRNDGMPLGSPIDVAADPVSLEDFRIAARGTSGVSFAALSRYSPSVIILGRVVP